MRVLVTRPRLDAERTARKLAARGHEALIDPVIEIERVDFDLAGANYSAIAFTSANAVRIAEPLAELKTLPVFAVGPRTAEVARECGFWDVRAAQGDVVSLGNLIAGLLPPGAHILHLAGEDRAGDLPGRLSQSGITTETKVIYRARAARDFSEEAAVAFRQGSVNAVLHYSERSAAAFVKLSQAAGIVGDIGKARHLCLSSAVATPLNLLGLRVEIAASPHEEALFKLLGT